MSDQPPLTAQMLREAFQQAQREILAGQQTHATRWERMAELLNAKLRSRQNGGDEKPSLIAPL